MLLVRDHVFLIVHKLGFPIQHVLISSKFDSLIKRVKSSDNRYVILSLADVMMFVSTRKGKLVWSKH